MGRVTTEVTLENLEDVMTGALVVRAATVAAVTDPDVMVVGLPVALAEALGLRPTGRTLRIRRGSVTTAPVHDSVRLTVHGRSCSLDVFVTPGDDAPVVGLVAMTGLDLVIGPDGRLTGNPAHAGEWVIEAL